MAKFYDTLDTTLQDFVKKQHIFFVATAADAGRVNLSPKGTDTFRIIDETKVAWLNLTGSGNETAAHILQNNRMTIMFCAFEDKPLILRLYGSANAYHDYDDEYQDLMKMFDDHVGARQIFVVDIESVQTSCGFAVPLMNFQEDRKILDDWSKDKGKEALRDYWKLKNEKSIDGYDTQIFNTNE